MKKRLLPQYVKTLTICGLALTLSSMSLSAAIVADFTAGNTTAEVDGYAGKAGDGWLSAWALGSNNSVTTSATVLSTDPLYEGGGNYLSVTGSTEQTSSRNMYVRRRYGDYEDVLLNSSHSLSFYYRIDSGLSDLSRIRIYNATASNALGTSDTTNWKIRSFTDWRFATGDTDSFTASNVRVYEGDNYFFLLEFDLATGLYTATVTNLSYEENERSQGVATATITGLQLFGDLEDFGGYLYFNALFNSNTGGDLRTVNYAIDGITIIPESSAVALGIGAGMLLLWGIRRQRSLNT